MYAILNRYLFQHKSINIPGLGTIFLEATPASLDASTRTILPPAYYFRFDKYFDTPDKDFFTYLATTRRIPEYEAMRQYNEFAYNLRERVNHQQGALWEGVGELSRDSDGNIQFSSLLQNPAFLQPVPAEKRIRPNAQHTLLVGDQERTSEEMSQWFSEEPDEGNRLWWLIALLIGLAALLVMAIHFSSHGWSVESVGNQQSLQIAR